MISSVNVTPIAPSAMMAPGRMPSASAWPITGIPAGSSNTAQERFANSRVIEERARRTREVVLSFRQHVAAIGHAQRGSRVLLHHQHRDPRFGEPTEVTEHFFDDA